MNVSRDRIYLARAGRYLEAADCLVAASGSPADLYDPIMTLLLTSSELSLKASLLKAEEPEEDVRKHGHDIGSLLVAAVERGLEVALYECIEIFLMVIPYTRHAPRYLPLADNVIMRPLPRFHIATKHIHERSVAFIEGREPDGSSAYPFAAISPDEAAKFRAWCEAKYREQASDFDPMKTWPPIES